MGKYDNVTEGLPRLLDKEVEKIVDFNTRADKYRGMSAVSLATKWTEQRAEEDRIEAELKEVTRELEVLRILFIRAAESEGIEGVSLASGRTVSLGSEPYASVENPDEFRQWCREHDLDRSLQLPWQTTNSLTKERILAGYAPPPGIKVYLRDKLTLRNK